MEYYLPSKGKEILPLTIVWMDLEDSTEIQLTRYTKTKTCKVSPISEIYIAKLKEAARLTGTVVWNREVMVKTREVSLMQQK